MVGTITKVFIKTVPNAPFGLPDVPLWGLTHVTCDLVDDIFRHTTPPQSVITCAARSVPGPTGWAVQGRVDEAFGYSVLVFPCCDKVEIH